MRTARTMTRPRASLRTSLRCVRRHWQLDYRRKEVTLDQSHTAGSREVMLDVRIVRARVTLLHHHVLPVA